MRKEQKIVLESKMIESIQKLEAGDVFQLKIVYEAIAFDSKEIVRKAGSAIGKCIKSFTAKQMITLSERFREYTSMDWFIEWKNIDIRMKKEWFASTEDYVYVLVLGSFHPNGYFRERCAKELYHYPNTLGYLLLRANDWVEPIRKEMCVLCAKKIENCSILELFLAVQHMDKLRRSGRIGYEETGILNHAFQARMEETLPQIPLEKIRYFEFATRKIIYRMLIQKKLVDFSQINELLEREKHSFCKQILITGALQYYDCSTEQLEKYLRNKNGIVRRRALEYRYAMEKDVWDGLEWMLLDSNKGVRELAVYIIEKHSKISVLDFYIEHLQDENPFMAITGVGEHGGKEEGKMLLPFLNSPITKVVCATLKALAKTMEMDAYDIFPEYLGNKELAISKAAYLAIRASGIYYGAERLYEYCINWEYPHVRRYVVHLLLQENSWKRLPFLLKLYGREAFAEYEELLLRGIGCRDMYGKISKQQKEQIEGLLKDKEEYLSTELIKNIKFDMKFVVEKDV